MPDDQMIEEEYPDPQTTIEEIAELRSQRDRLNGWVVELEQRLNTANARLLGAGLPDA